MTTNAIPTTPIPNSVKRIGPWETCDDTGASQTRWAVWGEHDGGRVAVDGRQWPDGTVDAAVSVYIGDGEPLDGAQARKLAAALLDAADELDGLGLLVRYDQRS